MVINFVRRETLLISTVSVVQLVMTSEQLCRLFLVFQIYYILTLLIHEGAVSARGKYTVLWMGTSLHCHT